MNLEKNKLLLVFAFFSGFSALVYELVWFKKTHLVFGVGSYALSAVLTAFLLGLVFGSYYGGRFVDKKNSFRSIFLLYSKIEFLIGVFALLVPVLLGAAVYLVSLFYNSDSNFVFLTFLRFVFSLFVLVIPASFIGATFPVMLKIYSEKNIKESVSLLYFVNTLGGFFGVLLTGFLFIRFFGVSFTLYLGVLINFLISFFAFFYSKKYGTVVNENDEITRIKYSKKEKIITLLMFFSGFMALAYEVIFGRLLVLYFFGTIYATSILIALFLLGIALGSFFYGRFFTKKGFSRYVYVNLLIVVLVLFGLLFYSSMSDSSLVKGFGSSVFVLALFSLIIVFLPAMGFGILFPLLSEMFLFEKGRLGTRIGVLYSVNTLGSILGALAAGFVFVPWLGLKKSLFFLIFLGLILSLFISIFRKKYKEIFYIAIVFCSVLFVWSNVPSQFSVPLKKGFEIAFYDEGLSGTVSVIEGESNGKLSSRLFVDNQEVAGNTPILKLDSKILAHLPLLLHKDPKKVLTVGFGTGGTSYSMLRHDLEKVDAVEIEANVLETTDYFNELNHEVLEDTRLKVIIDDARSYLFFTDERYDVIVTDVTNIRYKSNANLYTKEYFELLKQRTNEGGIVAAWVPVADIDEKEQKILMKTFKEVFPEMSVWYMYHKLSHFLVYVGSEEKLVIDYVNFKERFNKENVKDDLAEVGVTEFNFLNSLFLDGDAVNSYVDNVDVHTDNYPTLEFPDLFPDENSFTFEANVVSIYERKIDPLPYILNYDSEFLDNFRYEQSEVATPLLEGHKAILRGDIENALQNYKTAVDNSDSLEVVDLS